MRFNSVIYWAFLAAVVAVYWLVPQKARKGWLLAASYLFYASWHWPYLLLLVGSATVNWWGAGWIARAPGDRKKRGALILAIDVLALALFKYLDWLLGGVVSLFSLLGLESPIAPPHWLLPLGISFYLFESMSYIIDVVRKREQPHPFWDIQLFIAFFPKLIAGPILRAKELLPQFNKLAPPALDEVKEALRMILIGLFLKVVIADGLAPSIDKAFAKPVAAVGGIDAWMMAIGFGLQIYLDFSSYSRIAIGSARLFGIKLVDNFNHPYVSSSPPDFWNRWHMSLSRWIRDYLFYPLVGKKQTLSTLCRAALGSMVLCGIWHGAGLTFVVWGLWHGILTAGYHLFTHGKPRTRPNEVPLWRKAIGILGTFLLVMLGWTFFRASSLPQAFGLIGHALLPFVYRERALGGTFYLHVTALVAAMWIAPCASAAFERWASAIEEKKTLVARAAAFALAEGVAFGAMVAVVLVYLRGQSAFIYFQF
jgi:D-alanyl-lipoteichoic acid acyltransferase DltB (MBOAT superfamily)